MIERFRPDPVRYGRDERFRLFHLVEDVIDRRLQLRSRAAYAKQMIRKKLRGHKQYVAKHGDDMPEVCDWK
ncbi:MAG: hypothetical protein JSR62_11835 [Nitrospira sp.]|nr:hypothetical protein [Nitrospira sp.]